MEKYSLIANTGIHIASFPIEIDTKGRFNLLFREWFDKSEGEWMLELVQNVQTETQEVYYSKKTLFDNGYLISGRTDYDLDVKTLEDDGIRPLMIDDQMKDNGEIYKMDFQSRFCALSEFENKWLPVPYLHRGGGRKFLFEALNWSRFKLVPIPSERQNVKCYNVLLAFDTRTKDSDDKYKEWPVFHDNSEKSLQFEVCTQEFQLMMYGTANGDWGYINDYIFRLVHPDCDAVGNVKSPHKTAYIASYFLLIDYIAQNKVFPQVTLYTDKGVDVKDIDMVIDIGNSRTTALLVEDNFDFNQVSQLRLVDYTATNESNGMVVTHNNPFDMRIALRKVNFGDFGVLGSHQFVYPSIVRLGDEAVSLIYKASETDDSKEKNTTLSSPKRYLWDGKKTKDEWQFIVLDGEKDDHILNVPGISEHLQSDGSLSDDGNGGRFYNYSRRSMMTFAFLEMLVQASTQINSDEYRTARGNINSPRRIRRVLVTCPTAMSKLEREALVKSAADAVKLLNKFNGSDNKIEIVPLPPSFKDREGKWYYDEATCSQLVYIYGEVGYKYKGCCQEFFNLYGKENKETGSHDLTIGSLDIGAGTTDLMISRYSYTAGNVTTIFPEPVFYDSFYYAGDDMLNELIKNVVFFSQTSALRRQLKALSDEDYRQKLRGFFGPNYNGQTIAARRLRCDFNLQYTVPLMYKYLDLLSNNAVDCVVRYKDIFSENEPNERVREGFKKYFGFAVEDLEWRYESEAVSEIVKNAFEDLLKKIAAIMYSYKCDIILLSGRPASLAPIRNIFLKYYSVSPNRLILLNNYFVGHWYPFGKNTGHIKDAKTIVAVGALIGYYATSLGNLDKFVIDKSKLDESLKSTVNYIEASRENLPVEYFITPEAQTGSLLVTTLPTALNVRQLSHVFYPSRKLFVIDFNQGKMEEKTKLLAAQEGNVLTDPQVSEIVKEKISNLRKRMPFRLEIEQAIDDKEKLSITAATDKNGDDIMNSNIEISVRSLGVDDNYWLDTGAFEIQ